MAVGTHRLDLLAPHNEHWSTLPKLAWWALLETFGLKSYLPYAFMVIAVHLVLAHLLWRILRRAGTEPILASLLVAVFVVLGAGAENLLWAFQVGFVGSVAFGLGGVLLADHVGVDRRLDAAAVACGIGGLLCSGVGITMVAVITATAYLRRGWRAALETVAVPAAVFVAWFALKGHNAVGTTTKITAGSLLSVPQFLWTGLTTTFDRASAISGGGAVLVLALLVFGLRRIPDVRGPAAPAVACAAGAVFFYCFVGVGRTGLGVEEAMASRYSYISIALLLPVIGLAVGWLAAQTRAPLAVGAGVCLLLGVQNLSLLRSQAADEATRELAVKSKVLAAAQLERDGEPVLRDRPEPVLDPDIDMARLARLDREGWLPSLNHDEVGELDARVNTQTDVHYGPSRVGGGPAELVTTARVDLRPSTTPGCDTAHPTGPAPQLVLDANAPTSFTVRHDGGGTVTIYLRDPGNPSVISDGASFPLPALTDATVDIGTRGAQAIVSLPDDGDSLVCGLRR